MGYTTVSLPFGGGIDTKTDPKMVAPSKLTVLQDCIFSNFKRITKRPGTSIMTNALVGGGTWSSPTMCASYRNELVLAASTTVGPRLLSYSPTLTAWQDKGKYVSVAVSKQVIASNELSFEPSNFGYFNTNCAVSGNIALYTYETAVTGNNSTDQKTYFGQTLGAVYYSVLDLQTNTVLAQQVQLNGLGSTTGFAKPCVLGSGQLAILYINSTGHLCVVLITVTQAGGVVAGSEIQIVSCQSSASSTTQFPYCYDFVNTSTGATLAIATNTTLSIYSLTTAGAFTSRATITLTSPYATPININTDAAGNFWIYWADGTHNFNYAIYSSSYTQTLAPTVIASAGDVASQVTAFNNGAGNQIVYFSGFNTNLYGTLSTLRPVIIPRNVNSTGTVTVPASLVNTLGADIFGKPFTVGTITYLPLISWSSTDSTGVLIDALNGGVVGKFLQGSAEDIFQPGYNLINNNASHPSLISGRYFGFLSNANQLTTTKFLFGAGEVYQNVETILSANTNGVAFPLNLTTASYLTATSITFDFASIDAYQALQQQDLLVLNGGIVSLYDGNYISELGYTVDPDLADVTPSTASGNIPAGTFTYYVTYSWLDANGNIYQSAPSNPMVVVFNSGSTNLVSFNLNPNTLTAKKDVQIQVWRSDSNVGGGLNAYLILAGPVNGTTTFTDTLSSAAGSDPSRPTLYTLGNAVLPNIAPPPSMIMWTNNNRIWAIDSENPETTVEYSKTAAPNVGISFSTGLLEYLIDSKNGAVTGASPMDEKTVLLKANGVGYFIGDGANDSGTGSTLTSFQFIPADTGCSNSKSVISFPSGLLFRASNNKGVYLVSRGVQIQYFGLDVSSFSAQDIQAAQIVGNKNQIRFLTSSGMSLLYDYVMGQWSAFTNYTGLSSCIWQGVYTYVRTDGTIYLEDQTGTFLDNGTSYAPKITTAMLKTGVVQNFQRIRRFMMLGDFQTSNNGHGIQVSASYDFGISFSAPIPYVFTGSNAAFQYRERLPRQKCDTLQLQIQEIVTGASGEYIDLSDLGLEVLLKSGLNKLPGTQSVG